LQFTLTVLNYYAHLRGPQSPADQTALLPLHHGHRHSSSSPRPQRVLLISSPTPSTKTEEDSVWVYSRVQVPKRHVERLGAREAYLSIPPMPSSQEVPPKDGAISLPIREGEAPWTRGGHVRRMTLEEYEQFKDEK